MCWIRISGSDGGSLPSSTSIGSNRLAYFAQSLPSAAKAWMSSSHIHAVPFGDSTTCGALSLNFGSMRDWMMSRGYHTRSVWLSAEMYL